MYYLITYVWRINSGTEHTSMTCWEGSIADWVYHSTTMYPEKYMLINAEPLTKEEFESLHDEVGG